MSALASASAFAAGARRSRRARSSARGVERRPRRAWRNEPRTCASPRGPLGSAARCRPRSPAARRARRRRRSRSRRSIGASPISTPRRTPSKRELSELGGEDRRGARALARRAVVRSTGSRARACCPVGGGFNELVSHAHARRALASRARDRPRRPRRSSASAAAISRARSSASRAIASRSASQRSGDGRRARSRSRTSRVASRRSTARSRRRTARASTSRSTAATALRRDRAGGGFATSRGRLLFPLAGRSEVRPAQREGTDGPGPRDQAARSARRCAPSSAVASRSRIATARTAASSSSTTATTTTRVSGNLAAIDVKVGDEVSAGERIGTVGDEGKGRCSTSRCATGPRRSRPAPWLGL